MWFSAFVHLCESLSLSLFIRRTLGQCWCQWILTESWRFTLNRIWSATEESISMRSHLTCECWVCVCLCVMAMRIPENIPPILLVWLTFLEIPETGTYIQLSTSTHIHIHTHTHPQSHCKMHKLLPHTHAIPSCLIYLVVACYRNLRKSLFFVHIC